jgi:creatinine amidohydrolase
MILTNKKLKKDTGMPSYQLEELNAVQVRKNINKRSIAVIVLGACENHGDHMPFSSDFIFPMELVKRLAGKLVKPNAHMNYYLS